VPEGVTASNWKLVRVEHKLPEPTPDDPIEAFIWQWVYGGMDEMPFLPIEQLPEAWKDGREVLMDTGGKRTVVRYGKGPYDELGWLEDSDDMESNYQDGGAFAHAITPTHFCPIPLKAEV
jgi:hypothetical protein